MDNCHCVEHKIQKINDSMATAHWCDNLKYLFTKKLIYPSSFVYC